MTVRFSATTLDLSRQPPPEAIRGVDYEAILSERKARLVELFDAAGVAYDVDALESDWAVIVQQTDAYRELLGIAAINDAVRSVMLAFARGSDLDHLAADMGVSRMIGESDERFRARVLVAPEAYGAAGPHGAYVYHALSADARVTAVDVWSPSPGAVTVAVQTAETDGTASAEVLTAVRSRLSAPEIKPLTDALTVRSVTAIPYAIEVVVYVLPGPDPEVIRASALASLTAMAAARKTPSRDVPLSAIYAAASVGGVERVAIISPGADVARGVGEVGHCSGITVSVEATDG